MSITLEKGQVVALTQANGANFSHIYLAAGWDAESSSSRLLTQLFGETAVDLDASLLLLDDDNSMIEVVYFGQLNSSDGSIIHSGDSFNGQAGDNETIHINLFRVPDDVETMILTLSSFCGQNLEKINQAICRIVDAITHEEIAQFNVGSLAQSTALIVVKIYRDPAGWCIGAIGEICNGRTFKEMMPCVLEVL